jgi:ketosteroid isomerase-like protein
MEGGSMRARIVSVSLIAAFCAVGPAPGAHDRAAAFAAAPDAAAEVLAFEREMEAAVVRGDVAFLDRVCTSDFSFTHGDGWTTGGAPLRVENKAQWLAAVAKAPYLFRTLDSVKVEPHGDIAITYGRYQARFKVGEPGRREFIVWFERVYARRGGEWRYVSHRTVHGPIYLSEQASANR